MYHYFAIVLFKYKKYEVAFELAEVSEDSGDNCEALTLRHKSRVAGDNCVVFIHIRGIFQQA